MYNFLGDTQFLRILNFREILYFMTPAVSAPGLKNLSADALGELNEGITSPYKT